jgi:hypothetical protein
MCRSDDFVSMALRHQTRLAGVVFEDGGALFPFVAWSCGHRATAWRSSSPSSKPGGVVRIVAWSRTFARTTARSA